MHHLAMPVRQTINPVPHASFSMSSHQCAWPYARYTEANKPNADAKLCGGPSATAPLSNRLTIFRIAPDGNGTHLPLQPCTSTFQVDLYSERNEGHRPVRYVRMTIFHEETGPWNNCGHGATETSRSDCADR